MNQLRSRMAEALFFAFPLKSCSRRSCGNTSVGCTVWLLLRSTCQHPALPQSLLSCTKKLTAPAPKCLRWKQTRHMGRCSHLQCTGTKRNGLIHLPSPAWKKTNQFNPTPVPFPFPSQSNAPPGDGNSLLASS